MCAKYIFYKMDNLWIIGLYLFILKGNMKSSEMIHRYARELTLLKKILAKNILKKLFVAVFDATVICL